MERLQKIIVAALVVSFSSLLMGCVSRQLQSAPNDWFQLQLTPSDYKVISPVSGQDCVTVVLIFQFTSPDLLAAEQAALSAAPGAELLLNKHLYWQTQTVFPGIITLQCIYVEGLAAKLTR